MTKIRTAKRGRDAAWAETPPFHEKPAVPSVVRRAAAFVGPGQGDDPAAIPGLDGVEQQVVRGLVRGQAPAAVADSLGLTLLAVRSHMKRIYRKLDVSSRDELTAQLSGFQVH